MQDSSYTSLLHIPDVDDDLMTFEELRPAVKHTSLDQLYDATYYDPASFENACSSGMYNSDLTNTPQSLDVTDSQEVDTTVCYTRRKRKASLKQNHSEIEKRRRDKMNTYITELSSMIPMCSSTSRKVDKITVLRMAVEYLKTIRGPDHSYNETHYKPPFITDQDLKQLILQVAEGFLFVVGCDRGKILYMSSSVSKILNFPETDLLRQSLFDILHPKDVAKVKEQLSSSDHNPRDRFISSKISRLCPGARRSFFCRMKCNVSPQLNDKSKSSSADTADEKSRENQNSGKRYVVIHCTGYLKSWPPMKIGLDELDNDIDGESHNVSCLIAIGRMLSPITPSLQNKINTKSVQYISKHTLDGKFLFVDQRATLILGYLPQELLGCSMYEYLHQEDIPFLAETHKAVLHSMEKLLTKTYRFRTKENNYVNIQSEWRAFKNPWTKEIEYLISKNNLMMDFERVETDSLRNDQLENMDFINQKPPIPENHDNGIIELMEDVSRKTPISRQQSEGNDEAAMAIIMSLLEVDAGLGGPVDFSGLPWPLP